MRKQEISSKKDWTR